MKVFFHTLGCKVNRYETEYMSELLEKNGFFITEDFKKADLIVVNSCTVTAESDRKTRQLIRRYSAQNTNAAILLTGCMPQAFPEQAEALPADIILGNGSKRNIVKAVETYFKTNNRVIDIAPHSADEKFNNGSLTDFSERTRAYMKIEDGCNRGCAYCIIPKARGRVRSRSLEDIKIEAASLSASGFKEIVLVGINLSSYGSDINLSLADAVKTVASVDGIERVRLGSLEPDLTDDALLNALKNIPEFCPQFHLSLQSGDNSTLKRMNRLYTAEFYKKLVAKIRSLWSNATITTDIMVGFAGETDEEFKNSLDFAKDIKFLKAHIFPYSVRKGTAAATFKNQVDQSIKNKRAALMADTCNKATEELLKTYIGKTAKVLFETTDDKFILGHSENFTEVFVKADKNLLKTTQKVKIVSLYKTGVLAEIEK